MNTLVAEIDARFRDYFEQLATELRSRHPRVKFSVYGHSIGSSTSYQGYDLGIEALFPDANSNETDNIAFSITLCHLTTEPKIMVDASWGHGGGGSKSLWDSQSNNDWPHASPERFDEVTIRLPELADWFTQEINRGRPSGYNRRK